MLSASGDLVNEVLNTDDSVLSKFFLDDFVVDERDSLFVNFTSTSLVDELSDGLAIGVSTVKRFTYP